MERFDHRDLNRRHPLLREGSPHPGELRPGDPRDPLLEALPAGMLDRHPAPAATPTLWVEIVEPEAAS